MPARAWIPRRDDDPESLFVPVTDDPSGVAGPTHKSARGPYWRTSSRGRRVPMSVPITPRQRVVEAAQVLPEHGGVTGWAGLAWERATWFTGQGAGGLLRPVTLVTAGDDVRSQPGIAISAERLNPRELVVVEGVRLTLRARSVWFEMRYAASDEHAAVVLSMAAYDDLVSIAEVAEFAGERPGWTGAPRCRAALAIGHENCWSPTEVSMAFTWEVLAELPRPLCNEPLFDRRGNHIGTPDLLDVEAGVVGQYNGAHHLRLGQHARDLRVEERYRSHGLECFTVVAPDLADRSQLVGRMLEARGRARFERESTRTWTAVPPRWWTPTHTVDLRRALSPHERDRLLGYRRAA